MREKFNRPDIKLSPILTTDLKGAFLDRESEIQQIYSLILHNKAAANLETNIGQDRPYFIHINQASGMGKTTIGTRLLDFNLEQTRNALRRLDCSNDDVEYMYKLLPVSIKLRRPSNFSSLHDYLLDTIWTTACKQVFGLDAALAREYLKLSGINDLVEMYEQLLSMSGGRHFYFHFDEIQALSGGEFDVLFSYEEASVPQIERRIGRYRAFANTMQFLMNAGAGCLSTGRSSAINYINVSKSSEDVSLTTRRRVQLNPFTPTDIQNIVESTKFQESDNLSIAEELGIEDMSDFTHWLRYVTCGIPRQVKSCLYQLQTYAKDCIGAFNYRAYENTLKATIIDSRERLPLDLSNEDHLSLFKMAMLEMPFDAASNPKLLSLLEEKCFLPYVYSSSADGKSKVVSVSLPWYWLAMIERDPAASDLLGRYFSSGRSDTDKGIAFEHHVIYRLLHISQLWGYQRDLATLFPFLKGTAAEGIKLDSPFEVVYSKDRFTSSNCARLAVDMMDRCCKTQTPKIFVPAPKSHSQDLYLIFPSAAPEGAPVVVAIQCKNWITPLEAEAHLNVDVNTFTNVMAAISSPERQARGTLVFMTTTAESLSKLAAAVGVVHPPGRRPVSGMSMSSRFGILIMSHDQMAASFDRKSLETLGKLK